jgi:demethylmenaquinone methyltransferase/2-methoxy-6-polyprenyl-1,4-benzoquinol methylase
MPADLGPSVPVPAAAAPDLGPPRLAELFDRNATTYDRVNTVITFGLDASWRRWAAGQAVPHAAGALSASPVAASPPRPPRVLDACAGTGLLALALARRGAHVTAVDAAPRMLAVARDRLEAAGLALRTVVADLADEAAAGTLGGPFDAVTLGFGLRYFADPGAALRLLRGLLAPAGLLVILEAVRPPQDPLGAAAGLYFLRVAPRLGAALAGRAELYDVLTATTRALGSADEVASHLRRAGFGVGAQRRFACGVVAGFVARPV